MILLILTVLLGGAPGVGGGYTIPGVDAERVTMTVNVWGEVRTPGAHQVPWDADLIQALSAAGGPTTQADLGRIRIVYRDFQSVYNMRNYIEGRGATIPSMEPGVTIYVGRSRYEWWKDVVDFTYKIIVAVNLVLVITR